MATDQPKSLTIGALLRDSLLLFSAHWKRHFLLSFLCILPVAVLLASGFLNPVIDFLASTMTMPPLERLPDGTPSMTVSPSSIKPMPVLRVLSTWALMLMCVSAYATDWWTELFELRHNTLVRRPSWLSAAAAVLTRFILYAVLMIGVESVGVMIGGGILQLAGPMLQSVGLLALAQFIVTGTLQIVSMGIGMRIAVSIPPLVTGEDISFSKAWVASRGLTLTFGLTAMALALPALFLILVAADLTGLTGTHGNMMIQGLTVWLLAPLIFLYSSLQFTVLATGFRGLRASGRL